MRAPAPLGIAALLLAASLAGCLGADPASSSDADGPADGTEATADDAPRTVELRDCTEHYATFTVPASEAGPYLPDGFETVGVGGAPPADGTVALVLLGLACGDPATGETVRQVSAEIPVDPPERYAKEGALFQYVHVVGVVAGHAMLEAYDAWGLPGVAGGEVQIEVPRDHLVVGDGETYAVNGSDEVRLATTVAGPPQTLPGGTGRFFGVEDGEVTAIVDAEFTPFTGAAGRAVLEEAGLVPMTVDGPGAGGNFWGYDMTLRPAELPSAA